MIPEYWWPFLYQYGVGASIFVLGLYLIISRKSCVLSRKQDRYWLGVLLFGFLWYAGIHLAWYEAAIHILPHSTSQPTTRPADEALQVDAHSALPAAGDEGTHASEGGPQ